MNRGEPVSSKQNQWMLFGNRIQKLAWTVVSLLPVRGAGLRAELLPGIDISHWQGTINWASVAGGGYKFAFMKATESTSYVDPTFMTGPWIR